MQTYQSAFHATLPKDEADKACAEADYAIHSRDLPLSRRTSSRHSQEVIIIPASEVPEPKPATTTSKPVEYWQWDDKLVRVSSDSYEPNRLGSQS
jgi:hypothetical protein